jgi:hypothetical protein
MAVLDSADLMSLSTAVLVEHLFEPHRSVAEVAGPMQRIVQSDSGCGGRPLLSRSGETIPLSDGEVAVSREWNRVNIQNVLAQARSFGYAPEAVRRDFEI